MTGAELETWRKARGWDRHQLARWSGYAWASIVQFEHGRRKVSDRLVKMIERADEEGT